MAVRCWLRDRMPARLQSTIFILSKKRPQHEVLRPQLMTGKAQHDLTPKSYETVSGHQGSQSPSDLESSCAYCLHTMALGEEEAVNLETSLASLGCFTGWRAPAGLSR